MSTLKHVILQDKDQDNEKLDWSYISDWADNEVVTTGVADAETQTDSGLFEHKECQTSSPVIMHIDLTRTHSKLRHLSLMDTEGLVAPLFQFDRQAPGRISTSPTLRRMRSTRRPVIDPLESGRMGSTQEESSPLSPLSPVQRVKSPLATNPSSDGENSKEPQSVSSSGRQRTRSHRSKTFENGIPSTKLEGYSADSALMKSSGVEVQSPGKCSPQAPIHCNQQSPNNGGVSERLAKDNGQIYSSGRGFQAGAFSIECRQSPHNVEGF
ncbi:PREDICTED: uncharacterized protein C12orf74 homolog [Cyprinodon variegatus]|uniref:uncharacterized protein C12orf74 homolog n=1 Tax=Cyprinodon variegatus TaxID=28743 RepID=UPI0007426FF7|nr:PREDICTED: uncharacterized protein C12orf74 homolog [Cyprinodon variegatus]